MIQSQTKSFRLGGIFSTPGALSALADAGQSAQEYLARHARCDWGDVCAEDKKLNDQPVTRDERLLSAYTLKSGVKIWAITEADRSVTTLLLPDEY